MRNSDPRHWNLELGRDGYYVVDEYGEDIGFAGSNYTTAKRAFDEMVRDDIAAREQEGPDLDPMRGVEFPFAENH